MLSKPSSLGIVIAANDLRLCTNFSTKRQTAPSKVAVHCFFFFPQNDSIYSTLSRKKTFGDEPEKDKLNRVLNVFDLTSMGLGCTLGCGIYVMAGNVARLYAGPAVVLSFVIAAVVSSLSGVRWSSGATTLFSNSFKYDFFFYK